MAKCVSFYWHSGASSTHLSLTTLRFYERRQKISHIASLKIMSKSFCNKFCFLCVQSLLFTAALAFIELTLQVESGQKVAYMYCSTVVRARSMGRKTSVIDYELTSIVTAKIVSLIKDAQQECARVIEGILILKLGLFFKKWRWMCLNGLLLISPQSYLHHKHAYCFKNAVRDFRRQ